MPYLVDRERAIYTPELVVVQSIRQRRLRSRVILRDNSLYQTLTRVGTWVREASGEHHYRTGVQWHKPR